MSQHIQIEINQHVAHVRMCRPERHNALDAAMFQALFDAGVELQSRAGVRAIVLSGDGPSFCSGLDFPSFTQPGQDINLAFRMGEGAPANYAQRIVTVWRQQAVPVLAAIQGVAYGGGFQLAMGADFRIGAPTARMSLMEIDYGLIPDMGVSQTLPSLLRYDTALELALSGRRLDGHEALAMGLLTQLAEEPVAAALAWAQDIAARSPTAVRANKQLLRQCWAADPALLAEEARLQQAIMQGPDYREALNAKLQRREARFADQDKPAQD